jgi:hypothetical protein
MDELNVQPIDVGYKLRKGVQLRLHLSPVVIGRPIVRELLHGRELDALRRITDRLFARPPCCRYAPTEFNELVFWNVDVEGSDLHCCVVRVAVNLRSRELRHGGLLFVCRAFL